MSRNIRLKAHQAETAVDVCAAVWVEYGVSIRDVSLGEAIVLRNKRAAGLDRLACAELPGLVYEPSIGAMEGYRRSQHLARCAREFWQQAGQTAAIRGMQSPLFTGTCDQRES